MIQLSQSVCDPIKESVEKRISIWLFLRDFTPLVEPQDFGIEDFLE